MTNTHIQRVRILYKSILRLHRGLPTEIRTIGDQYIKEEFRRHKEINLDKNEKIINTFMW